MTVTTDRRLVRLGDVAQINPTWDKNITPDDPVSFVGMANMSDEAGRTMDEEVRTVAQVRKGFTPFRRDDLLVAKITPCFENGKIGRAAISNRLGAGSTEFHVVRPGKDIDGSYALHFLRRPDFRVAGELRMTGSGGQRRVPVSYVAETKIPLPPLDEQRRISAILDKADELRTKRREALAHLNTLTQSIFHSTFGDPVSNPQEWPLHPLSELGNLDRGVSKHRPRNDPKLLGGPYPLVQTGDVARAGAYLTTFAATYSELGLRQSRLWPAGTLCITIAANIAKTAILKIQACFPDSVVGFTANPATTQYVRVWLSFLQATLEAQAPESAQKNINLAILNALQVPVPPLELQQAFATRITAVERLKETHRKHLAELDALFASLQHRAFKGEL